MNDINLGMVHSIFCQTVAEIGVITRHGTNHPGNTKCIYYNNLIDGLELKRKHQNQIFDS